MEVESKVYYTRYVRNSTAVAIMWGIFTICYAVINIVVFLQPQWIGDTEYSPGIGFFGLYEYCQLFNAGRNQQCAGRFDNFDTILSPAFKASAVFIGISAILFLLCIFCFIFFILVKNKGIIFMICGLIQLLAGICMFLGCVIYPAGWDRPEIRAVCGSSADRYRIAYCGIRWAYILAIVGIFDALILAMLAFVLAWRQANRLPDYVAYNGGLTKSEMNGYVYDTESKPSMIIQPSVAVPAEQVDAYSDYSQTSGRRSKKGDFSL